MENLSTGPWPAKLMKTPGCQYGTAVVGGRTSSTGESIPVLRNYGVNARMNAYNPAITAASMQSTAA